MKLLAAKEWNKMFYENGQKYRIKVRAELVHRDGNANAYFAITGEVIRHAKNGRKVSEYLGCIHEEIIKHFPQLQPLVDIHLANEDGVPMHAYSNASYWAGQSKSQALDLERLTKHLRVSQKLAIELVEYIDHFWNYFDGITTPEMAWETTCSDFDLPDYWNKQAQEAKLMLNIMEEAK